jgi:CRP-like cAMP-binding protein
MQQSIPTILSLAELFDSLTKTQLELVASICEPATFDAGTILIQENESSDELYVIGRGTVEIMMNPGFVSASQEEVDAVVVAELRHGQVFGEIALVDQGIRSATARVSQNNTYILRIPRKRLMLLCDTYPYLGYKLMKNLAADMAMKMRNTDLTIRYYQLKLADTQVPDDD